MLVVALIIAWRIGEPLFYFSLDAATRGVRPLWDPAVGVVAGTLVILLSDQLTERTRAGAALADALAELLNRLSVAECLLLAVASGVAEEVFFRGVLQPYLGLIAASFIFGLAHFVPRRDLALWTPFAVVVGFLFGILFESTGNLLAPVVAHVTINAVNLHRLSRRAPATPA
jgi:membrane protease YdiL (CAAX protease family)